MIKIIKNILNGLHRGARRVKELSYGFINFFGAGLKLNHFSKEDLKKHEQWYAKPQLKKLLESVTRFPDKTLRYFQLKLTSTNIYEPEYKFRPPDNSYMDHKGNELLYSYAKNILGEVNQYVAKINQKKNFLTEMLSADQDKMMPDLMVLSFVAEYIEHEMINYKNDPDELLRIDNLITYFSKLTGIDNIKTNSNFLRTIFLIRAQLIEARKKLAENISRTASVTTLGLIENLTRTMVGDLSHFLTSVIQFNDEQTKYMEWDTLAQKLFTQDLMVNTDDLSKYETELGLLISHEYEYSDSADQLASICPAFIDKKRIDQKVCLIIKKLQDLMIEAISIFQVMRYANTRLNGIFSDHGISAAQIKDIIFRLEMIIKDLKDKLQACYEWRSYFDKYCESHEGTDAISPKFDAIISIGEVIINNIDILFSKIKFYRDSVSTEHAGQMHSNQHVEQMLQIFFKHKGLQNKCKSVVSREIKDFINSFRCEGVFNKEIAVILGEYFYIENTTKPDAATVISQKVTHLKSASTTEPVAYEYLSILLSIVIKIYKQDFSKAEESIKAAVITRLVDFIIKNLLVHDSQAIKLLFTTMLEQTSLAASLEEKNQKLKLLIHEHVTAIKENILNMISSNSRMFHFQAQDDDQDAYLKPDEQADFINIVMVFVRNVLVKVKRSKEKFAALRAVPELSVDYVSADSITNSLQKLESVLKENNEISELLIASVSALTSISTSVVYLQRECELIETGVADSHAQMPQEIVTLLHRLEQERMDLQACTENIQLRIQDIKSYAHQTNNEIFSRIRDQVQNLLIVYERLSQFALFRHHVFSAQNGLDIIFEFAAVKYMYILVCHAVSNDDSNNIYKSKLLSFICLLKSSGVYTQFFTAFINNIYLLVVQAVPESQVIKLPLITTSWRSSGLLVSVQKVECLQDKIEKDMDACFSRCLISA